MHALLISTHVSRIAPGIYLQHLIMAGRDEFTAHEKQTLAEKTDYKCCICDKKSTNGQAAHISAAAEGGPRYQHMSTEQRKSISNGIWLCRDCHFKVDNDPSKYNVDYLRAMKKKKEGRQ